MPQNKIRSFKGIRYNYLPLDTKLFGFGVAKIVTPRIAAKKLHELLDYLRSYKIRLVYWAVPEGNKQMQKAAQHLGGFLSSKQVTYRCKLVQDLLQIRTAMPVVIYRKIKPTSSMYSLALNIGERSRFGTDPQLGPKLWHKLYRTWIANAVNGSAAKKVFVVKYRRKIVGMLTVGMDKRCGQIILIAVDEKMRGKKIGTQLIYKALRYLRGVGATHVQVVTQKSNISACHLYTSCGFKLYRTANFYHFWLDSSPFAIVANSVSI